MEEMRREIKKYFSEHLSESNIDRLKLINEEYQKFIKQVQRYILDTNYKGLFDFFRLNLIDNDKNIERYSKELLDLYYDFMKYPKICISRQEAKIIFWTHNGNLYKYISPYTMKALMMWENNILVFYKNKKSDKQALASVINQLGKEIFKIHFPTKEDSECANENISYYGAHMLKNNKVVQITFTNGACRFDFGCQYDLKEKKYISSNFIK